MARKEKAKREISKRLLYTLITIGILAIIGVGVYAYGTSNPSSFGHSAGELSGVCLSNGTGCLSSNGSSQWTTSGNNIYYSNGNVGIGGTPNPNARLNVSGVTHVGDIIVDGRTTLNQDLYLGSAVSSGHFIQMLGPSRVAQITFPSNALLLNDSWDVWNSFGPITLRSGGLLLNTQGYLFSKPTCDNAHRGMIWFTNSGGAGSDTIEVCRRYQQYDSLSLTCTGAAINGWIRFDSRCGEPL